MLTDFLSVGGVEVINTARLRAYLETVGSPLDSGSAICGCETLTADVIDPDGRQYTTPDDPDSPAPWYDPDVPESADFAGFLPLSFEGIDDYPVKRTVTNAVVGGGALGPARVQPRTITVTGLLLGATCCAVEYGLHFLGEALQGCTGSACGGDCVTMFNCCPGEEETLEEFNRRHRRTYRRVALVEGPTVTARNGDGSCNSGQCSIGADIITVEFVLVAATPWAWTDEVPLLDVNLPTDDESECITWCLHTGDGAPGDCADGGCRLAGCPDATAACADPACTPPSPPQPASPSSCFCEALATNRECYELDLSDRPAWGTDVPVISVFAGSEDLRRLTVSFYERAEQDGDLSCAEIADRKRCDPLGVFEVGFVPAGGTLVLDGQIGRATVECGGSCETSTSVWGVDGAPPTWPTIDCASICFCVETDAMMPPADDARLTVSVTGRGY
ncbi:hypothetical protein [Streptomyces sp. TRM68367]|uniref:hypothetical protein n=1 Tax=Streptomyces sp. TRM68367 TaxID=2758415 RepID=UPI00165C723C|nr:hypothetical protein [Streptomyces sp. TRM68367]MBC9729254.1 hypothetical protein [Streptomyces sp. TRM68367]